MNSIYVLDKLLKKAFLLILPTPAMRPMNNAIKKETSVLKKVIPKPGRINFVASRYSLLPVDSSILKRIVNIIYVTIRNRNMTHIFSFLNILNSEIILKRIGIIAINYAYSKCFFSYLYNLIDLEVNLYHYL